MSSPLDLNIKVQFKKNIMKRQIPEDMSYEEVIQMIKNGFGGELRDRDNVVIKYRDEVNDWITIFDTNDLLDAIRWSRSAVEHNLILVVDEESSDLTINVKFNGSLISRQIREDIGYEELIRMILNGFGGRLSEDVVIKYHNKDSDLITIFDTNDMSTAIRWSRSVERNLTLIVDDESTKEQMPDLKPSAVKISSDDMNASKRKRLDTESSDTSVVTSQPEAVVNAATDGGNSGVKVSTHYLKYVMFGTFKSDLKVFEIDKEFIKILNVSTNNSEIRDKYDINIRFNDIQELMHCSDPTLPLICLKPTKQSNDKINETLFLGNNSSNDFRFDINSENPNERYIIIVFNNVFGEQLVRHLNKKIQMYNKDIKCLAIDSDKGRELLDNSQQTTPRMPTLIRRLQTADNGETDHSCDQQMKKKRKNTKK